MMTGLILGDIIVLDFAWIELARLIGLYVSLHIIRFAFLFLFYPILKRTGYEFPMAQATLVAYGGLRGAVGLALALMVVHTSELPEKMRRMVLFHIAGIVLLTLVINGTTTGLLIDMLGLKKENKTTALLLTR